jgi:trans-2,3-dihydro-3-hydroxyanthranilate isomerase
MQRLGRIPANISCFAQAGPGRVITRMFAPALGVSEDPATGSACGPLAVHLARYGRIGFGEEIEVRQGAQIGRPSVLYARVDGAAGSSPGDAEIDRVLVGGRAVVVAHGHYRLR